MYVFSKKKRYVYIFLLKSTQPSGKKAKSKKKYVWVSRTYSY